MNLKSVFQNVVKFFSVCKKKEAYSMPYQASDIAKWFLAKNKSEIIEHETSSDDYEVYEGITHLKLQKLLYFAQGIYLALNNDVLFSDDIVAWQHGPVVKCVYDEYKHNGRNPIDIELNNNDEQLINGIENDARAIETLRLTYDNFAIYTAWQLREMTHQQGTPWDEAVENNGLNSVINTKSIRKYFLDEVIE